MSLAQRLEENETDWKLQLLEAKRRQLQEELASVTKELEDGQGLNDLVLKIRDAMNNRLVSPDHRLLFLPKDTAFKGERLMGFDVRIVDRPMALCAEDFPQGNSFVAVRKKRIDPKTLICLSPAVSIEDSLTGADWNDLQDRVDRLEAAELRFRRRRHRA